LSEYLRDDYELIVIDNSQRMHHEGLNVAAEQLLAGDAPYIGFLDHDVFPIRYTSLILKIKAAGFYGIGQRHPATGHLYLWPGFCFFSREWLAGRPLDFSGIRDGDKRNDGDTGSANWPLFQDEDWSRMYSISHGYEVIRRPDEYGLQSWGYERLGSDWIHFSNGSGWMAVPNPEERERLLFDLLADL
jgi:hypothetical protein